MTPFSTRIAPKTQAIVAIIICFAGSSFIRAPEFAAGVAQAQAEETGHKPKKTNEPPAPEAAQDAEKKHDERAMDAGHGEKKHDDHAMDASHGGKKHDDHAMDAGHGGKKHDDHAMDAGHGEKKHDEHAMDAGHGEKKHDEHAMDAGHSEKKHGASSASGNPFALRTELNKDAKPSALMKVLAKRERELRDYDMRLSQRKAKIDAAAEDLSRQIEQLEAMKADLHKLLATVEDAANQDVEHLVAVYARMKPKQAGGIFDKMEPAFAAGFLSRMKPERAATILAAMQPDHAYAISVELASRNVLPPSPR